MQRLGDAASAMRLGEQALAISTELGHAARRERAHSLKSIGAAYTMLGHFDEAESYSEQALKLHRELGNRRGVGNMLNSLGETARLRGDYRSAVSRYQEALTITREIGDRANEMTYLSNLGGARIGLSNYSAAEKELRLVIEMAGAASFAKSLRVWTESGMEAERARTLRAWARYEQGRGMSERARAMMEEARQIFTRLGMELEVERMTQTAVE